MSKTSFSPLHTMTIISHQMDLYVQRICKTGSSGLGNLLSVHDFVSSLAGSTEVTLVGLTIMPCYSTRHRAYAVVQINSEGEQAGLYVVRCALSIKNLGASTMRKLVQSMLAWLNLGPPPILAATLSKEKLIGMMRACEADNLSSRQNRYIRGSAPSPLMLSQSLFLSKSGRLSTSRPMLSSGVKNIRLVVT